MEPGKRIFGKVSQSLGFWTLSGFLLASAAAVDARAGDLEITFSAGVTETFTDNVDLDADGQEQSAILSDFVGNFTVRNTSARVNGGYDGTATLRHQTAGDEKGVSLLPSLRGFGNIEAIEDLFFVDTSSSVSREILSTSDADTEANRETVQSHSFSPYIVNRFDDFASSELRYTYDQTSVSNGGNGGGNNDASDTSTHTASWALNSGSDFNRFRWSLNASASESEQSDGNDVSRQTVTFAPEYAVVRGFSVLGSIGHESFEEEQNADDDFSGVTWRAGFRWMPSRRTELSATYGRSDNDNNVEAQFNHSVTARTRISASYNEVLETASERLANNLGSISIDPDTGEIINTNTGLPFDGNVGPTSLVDTATRTKTFQANVSTTRGRDTFNFGTTFRKQKSDNAGATPDGETGLVFTGAWSRRLNPQTNFQLNGSIDNTELDQNSQEDTVYVVGTGLDQNVYSNVNAFVNYTYRMRESTDPNQEYTENNISIGARATF